jgi:diguanylate cyclase (GGDEF)-like protein
MLAPNVYAQAGSVRLSLSQLSEPIPIKRDWQRKIGDSPSYAAPDHDDASWEQVALNTVWPKGGFPQSNQIAWYRLTVDFGRQARQSPQFLGNLGLKVGRVYSAFELYAGGQLIGSRGSLPPNASPDWDRDLVVRVPPESIGADGSLVLALRVWGGPDAVTSRWGGGLYGDTLWLGDYFTLASEDFRTALAPLFLAALFLLSALFSFYVYSRSASLRSYLWFALLSSALAVYCYSLSDLRFMVPLDFVVYEKVEYASVCFIAPLLVRTVWSILGVELTAFMRALTVASAGLGAVIAVVPGLEINFAAMDIFRVFAAVLVYQYVQTVYRAWREGDDKAVVFIVGSLVFITTSVHDLFVTLFFDFAPGNMLSMYGFFSLVVCMGVLISRQYAAVLDNLGELVNERTQQLRDANSQLARHAREDALTQLLNRRGFQESAEKLIMQAQAQGSTLSLILCDVDHFKRINDRYGHAVGDRVLQHLAQHLGLNIRDVDILGRWGGEEFILVLPELSLSGAQTLAQRLCDSLPSQIFRIDNIRLGLTMTFGVAQWRSGDSLEGVIARADVALYEGKTRGRCQVVSERPSAFQGAQS